MDNPIRAERQKTTRFKVITEESWVDFETMLDHWVDTHKDRFIRKTHCPCKNYMVIQHEAKEEVQTT